MRDHLVFTLYAPLAAFGEIAVGERRGTSSHPTRSAVLGLVAAALGLDRSDPEQDALAAGYDLAIRIDAEGHQLADYHTAQVPPTRKGRRLATRRAELQAEDLSTVLSRRDYRTDSCFTIVLVARARAPRLLAELADALRRPRFTLYVGRKSCPPGLPLDPRVLSAATVADALAAYDALSKRASLGDRFGLPSGRGRSIAADVALEGQLGARVRQQVRRRDALMSRVRWQFALRDEVVADLPEPGGDPG